MPLPGEGPIAAGKAHNTRCMHAVVHVHVKATLGTRAQAKISSGRAINSSGQPAVAVTVILMPRNSDVKTDLDRGFGEGLTVGTTGTSSLETVLRGLGFTVTSASHHISRSK